MNLNKLLLKKNGSEQCYKFYPGTGKFRHFYICKANESQTNEISSAIVAALSKDHRSSHESVTLSLNDPAGSSWAIHRQNDLIRYYRNNRPAKSDIDTQKILSFILDDDIDTSDINTLFQDFELKQNNNGISVNFFGEAITPDVDNLKMKIAKQIADTAQDCATLFDSKKLASPKVLSEIGRKCPQLHFRFLEVQKLLADNPKPEKAEQIEINAISREIAMIEQIEKLATPLFAKRRFLKEKKLKLHHVSNTEIPKQSASRRFQNVDIKKGAHLIAKVELYKKLIFSYQKIQEIAETRINPLFDQHASLLESLVERDIDFLRELEKSVSKVSKYLQQPEQSSDEKTVAQKWIDRIKANKETEEPTTTNKPLFETINRTMQDAISKIQLLREKADDTINRYHKNAQKFPLYNDNLVKQYAKAQNEWQEFANACDIDTKISLSDYYNLIIEDINQIEIPETSELSSEVITYKTQIQSLVTLIQEWRISTGSQKRNKLETATIVLSEAQSIINLKKSKLQSFKTTIQRASEQNSKLETHAQLVTRKTAIIRAWENVFEKIGVQPIAITDKRLDNLFQRANIIRSLAIIHGSQDTATKTQTLFQEDNNCALAFYRFYTSSKDNFDKLRFSQILDEEFPGETDRTRILFVKDDKLFNIMNSLGVGQLLEKSEPTYENDQTILAPSRSEPEKGFLNERAQHALNILTGRTK